ncbi:hypothetical protein DTL21_24095 [Bremerella cremea]|uniref:RNase H type-1 domain-containing protein n=1 Tax=Blastopirellula marina TaxID=124 RepID=A0A2S8FE54_9BACT|nr:MULTISPECIES: hypothetical protein [Pirellulaceae]PQO30439.1 hypothetical protein C5Y83_24050 [Blastopirellula marina]RCS43792.1 hypothetical protein DTL21_24095 [Bremerella cremea]
MRESTPLYLLATGSRSDIEGGRWQFVLRKADRQFEIAESDFEPNHFGDRVALLAVVRGLEAIPEPSRVLLLTPSRYILNGVRHGLCAWEDQGFALERLGRRVAVRNHDLWARVAQAQQFHRITAKYSESGLVDAVRSEQGFVAPSIADDIRYALNETQREVELAEAAGPLAACA